MFHIIRESASSYLSYKYEYTSMWLQGWENIGTAQRIHMVLIFYIHDYKRIGLNAAGVAEQMVRSVAQQLTNNNH